ncbi:hypothetical protein PMI42_04272 [Bradyrhizobium sp. YR681]|nr:hypothetical protein PMI42_04272 [Bradyrhizobium sp. YR681]
MMALFSYFARGVKGGCPKLVPANNASISLSKPAGQVSERRSFTVRAIAAGASSGMAKQELALISHRT